MGLPASDSIDALLLDLDDTILDDRAGIRAAWDLAARMLAEARDDLSTESVRPVVAEVTDWFWSDPERERRGRLDLARARFDILSLVLERLGCPDPELAAAAAREYTRYRETSYRLAEGALDALRRLRDGFEQLALVTNGASDPQRAKIERFELAAYFDHIQVEGEFGAGKPDPRVYAHVASVLGVPGQRCLMVGDNYRADVLGSLGAGMHAVWIDVEARGRPPVAPPRAHATVRSLAQLADDLRV